ncbi:MAG TPA: YciI family protein [Acidimicrobiales bacterium]|jgi:hypothetical protein|nr:YciI family protein [Acidimicrobiales bacterium]
MEYLFVIWESPEVATDEARRGAAMQQMGAFAMDLAGRGKVTGGGPLGAGGVQVRQRDDRTSVVDGPFTESREVIGGYFVVKADSRDEALEIAAHCPAASYGAVEVHPIIPMG